MSAPTILAPSAANNVAISAPIPEPEPVMIATLLANFLPISVSSLLINSQFYYKLNSIKVLAFLKAEIKNSRHLLARLSLFD